MRIVAEHSLATQSFNLFVMDETGGKHTTGVLEMVECDLYTYQAPTAQISEQAAQELFNSLWNAGIRPERESTEGQRAAMENHIADLRTVAFKLLKIGKEQE